MGFVQGPPMGFVSSDKLAVAVLLNVIQGLSEWDEDPVSAEDEQWPGEAEVARNRRLGKGDMAWRISRTFQKYYGIEVPHSDELDD